MYASFLFLPISHYPVHVYTIVTALNLIVLLKNVMCLFSTASSFYFFFFFQWAFFYFHLFTLSREILNFIKNKVFGLCDGFV